MGIGSLMQIEFRVLLFSWKWIIPEELRVWRGFLGCDLQNND